MTSGSPVAPNSHYLRVCVVPPLESGWARWLAVAKRVRGQGTVPILGLRSKRPGGPCLCALKEAGRTVRSPLTLSLMESPQQEGPGPADSTSQASCHEPKSTFQTWVMHHTRGPSNPRWAEPTGVPRSREKLPAGVMPKGQTYEQIRDRYYPKPLCFGMTDSWYTVLGLCLNGSWASCFWRAKQ